MSPAPPDCPMIEGDRRKDDKWRREIEVRIEELSEAMKKHSERHEAFVHSVAINNAQTQEMFDLFANVKQAFLFIGKVYSGAVWVFSGMAKLLKPMFVVVAAIVALVVWLKTGKWEWPL